MSSDNNSFKKVDIHVNYFVESHFYPTVAHQENLGKCNELDIIIIIKKLFRKKISKVKGSIIAELRYYFGSENVIQVARNRQGELNSVIEKVHQYNMI